MARYIPKDAVVAEIERRTKNLYPKGGQGIVVTKILKDHYEALLNFIDSMQEESASEELEEAAERYATEGDEISGLQIIEEEKDAFIDGAQWQKNHLWKPADGDDLPEIDREVIAIVDYDFGHYKVVYAHRPNPNGWNGTNIDTGEKEHFEPVIYDKGGWNQPHVLYWLDTRLPYEENKIDK